MWMVLYTIQISVRGSGRSISQFDMGNSSCSGWGHRGSVLIKFYHKVEVRRDFWLQAVLLEEVEGD